MRAALLLAVFVPLAIVAALFLGRRAVAAVERRQHRRNNADHIAQLEAENQRFDEVLRKIRERDEA